MKFVFCFYSQSQHQPEKSHAVRHVRSVDHRIIVGFSGRLQMAIVHAIFEFRIVRPNVHSRSNDT